MVVDVTSWVVVVGDDEEEANWLVDVDGLVEETKYNESSEGVVDDDCIKKTESCC